MPALCVAINVLARNSALALTSVMALTLTLAQNSPAYSARF